MSSQAGTAVPTRALQDYSADQEPLLPLLTKEEANLKGCKVSI
jgi:hypothetical protein